MKDDPPASPSKEQSVPLRWLCVSLFFRVFAYGLLYAARFRFDIPRLSPFVRDAAGNFFPLVLITSPLWVPFIAGFVGAYFWRHPQEKDYIRANWLCAGLFLGIGMVVNWLWAWLLFGVGIVVIVIASFAFLFCVAPFCLCIDVLANVYGGDAGRKFWNGRLGRQFFGDFSTDTWTENNK